MNKTYLLIPSVPTPNGGLHLGHIGGPYLSADVLARYLRLCGHRVLIMTGTDSFESHVAFQAEKENLTSEEICHHYHALIADDLLSMDIQVDQFVNPLDKKWNVLYKAWHEKILQQLIEKGETHSINESISWDQYQNRYLTGCWLKGCCPICKATVTGYFCENCGAHFRPEEVIKECAYQQKSKSNLFLQLPKTYDIQNKGINKNLENIFQQFLKQQNNLFRLTTQCDWGLPYNNDSVLFNYGFMFAYFLLLGEISGELLGTHQNAFLIDSSVITISSFGIDNAVPFLSSTLGITAVCREYKPFDHYLVNYFYYLNGYKFSTSRRHVIWISDIIKRKKLSSDIVRLYLSSINVRETIGHFDTQDFVNYYNKTVKWIEEFILESLQMLSVNLINDCDSDAKQQLNYLLSIQKNALQPNHFFPHTVIDCLDEWLKLGKQYRSCPNKYFWWLKAFCLFIYPFMPKLGKSLWRALGYSDFPILDNLFIPPSLPLQKKIPIDIQLINQTMLISVGGKEGEQT